VVFLVTQGGSVTRTKPLRSCMDLRKESVDGQRVVGKFTGAKGMIADGHKSLWLSTVWLHCPKGLDHGRVRQLVGTGFHTLPQLFFYCLTIGHLHSES
jgi:hypothetical protein